MDLEERPRLSAEAEREVTRLWRTWRTVLEMLLDRVRNLPNTNTRQMENAILTQFSLFSQGYNIASSELTISRDEFQRKFGDQQTGHAEYVVFHLSSASSRPLTSSSSSLQTTPDETPSLPDSRNDCARHTTTD